jgi:RimJ/RimL family protein N-acetyltransferase
MVDVMRLAPGDGALLRTTRLAALADAPAAFGTPFEVAAARPDEWWEVQCGGRLGGDPCATWVAVDDTDAATGIGIGMLTAVDVGEAVDIIQVWVAPDHRGEGIVEELFAAMEAWAPRARVDVAVAFGNDRARRTCERLGYELAGERRSEHGMRDVELLLSRQLSSGGGGR